ncbi:MAG: hypothetical protein Fur007_08210 [Rhodoferax sp.]
MTQNNRAWAAVRAGLMGVLTASSLFVAASLAQAQIASGLQPPIAKAQGGQCVADPAFMRRNHMKLLKHQRDDTMHGGVRTGVFSLKQCVSCHASPVSQSVTAQPGDFCRSCHEYAAVQIDCFECHANKPAASGGHALVGAAASLAQAQATPVQDKVKP